LAIRLTDDDHLWGSEATADMVLYSTIMKVWEKQIKNKTHGYVFPDAPEINPDADDHVISGQVGTWANTM